MKHVSFAGRMVILGFGSIGQGVLPLVLRHIDMPKDRITVLTARSAAARSPRNTASLRGATQSRARTSATC
jgi:homospermidine synthase